MTRFGVGPWVILLFLAGAAILFAVRAHFPDTFRFGIGSQVLRPAGFALLAAGLALWLTAIVAVQRAISQRRLVTTGAFAFCRHPVYASWAVVITPAIGLLLDTWLAFVLAVVFGVAVRAAVASEERNMETLFGDEYRAYCRRTPAVLPFGWLSQFRRSRLDV